MTLRGVLWFILLLFVYAALSVHDAALAQDRTEMVKVNGFPRSYEIHTPAGYDRHKSYPLVLALHGAGGDASAMAHLTHFDDTADKYGFIVVYPNARDAHWTVPQNENVRSMGGIGPRNRGIGFPEGSETVREMKVGGDPVHDMYYFNELLDQLESRYAVDTSRIYATGLSDGGFMDFRLACELAGRIAAIAPVSASMPQSMAESCSDWAFRPVPVLMINGTADPIVSYNGRLGFGQGYFLFSAKDSLKVWVKINECKGKPTQTTLSPNSPQGLETRVESYGECKENSEVILYSIVKGGHTWPGGEQYMPVTVIGKTNADLNANELIWKFFVAHPMPVKPSPPAQ